MRGGSNGVKRTEEADVGDKRREEAVLSGSCGIMSSF